MGLCTRLYSKNFQALDNRLQMLRKHFASFGQPFGKYFTNVVQPFANFGQDFANFMPEFSNFGKHFANFEQEFSNLEKH